jgi:hypothetical protein
VKGLADLYWDRGDKRLPDMSVPEFASVIKKRSVMCSITILLLAANLGVLLRL